MAGAPQRLLLLLPAQLLSQAMSFGLPGAVLLAGRLPPQAVSSLPGAGAGTVLRLRAQAVPATAL
jgi:hypothetical protein